MDPKIYRPVILHHFKEGKKPIEIHRLLVQTHGPEVPSSETVRYWVRKFKCGDESLADASRSGHPISAIDECLIEEIRRAIGNNRKIVIRTLAQATNSSYGTVHKIIHEYLGLEKKFAKWIPYNLNESQLEKRVKICLEFLREFSRNFQYKRESSHRMKLGSILRRQRAQILPASGLILPVQRQQESAYRLEVKKLCSRFGGMSGA